MFNVKQNCWTNNCTFVYNINDYSINEKQQFYFTQYCQAQKALLASFQCSIYFWEYLFTILPNKIQQPSIKSRIIYMTFSCGSIRLTLITWKALNVDKNTGTKSSPFNIETIKKRNAHWNDMCNRTIEKSLLINTVHGKQWIPDAPTPCYV